MRRRPKRETGQHMSMKWKAAVAASVVGALALSGCGGSSSGSDSGADSLSLVGFSILEQANKQVIADFTKTADGKGVEFEQSYGASGDQSRAVEGGQKADVVHFSSSPTSSGWWTASRSRPTGTRPRPRASSPSPWSCW